MRSRQQVADGSREGSDEDRPRTKQVAYHLTHIVFRPLVGTDAKDATLHLHSSKTTAQAEEKKDNIKPTSAESCRKKT